LGSAEITHPFHPLRGQKFVVLKLRSVRHPDLGSFALRQDWTDWSAPDALPVSQATSLMIDAFGLVELAMIVESLIHTSKKA
jgi:hypothetical protein